MKPVTWLANSGDQRSVRVLQLLPEPVVGLVEVLPHAREAAAEGVARHDRVRVRREVRHLRGGQEALLCPTPGLQSPPPRDPNIQQNST